MEIEQLRKSFDKVCLKHHLGSEQNQYRGSHAALVKGNKVFIGVSVCDDRDQFNRHVGREIAFGRAFYAYQVSERLIQHRNENRMTHSVPFMEVIEASSPEEVEKILDSRIFLKDDTTSK